MNLPAPPLPSSPFYPQPSHHPPSIPDCPPSAPSTYIWSSRFPSVLPSFTNSPHTHTTPHSRSRSHSHALSHSLTLTHTLTLTHSHLQDTLPPSHQPKQRWQEHSAATCARTARSHRRWKICTRTWPTSKRAGRQPRTTCMPTLAPPRSPPPTVAVAVGQTIRSADTWTHVATTTSSSSIYTGFTPHPPPPTTFSLLLPRSTRLPPLFAEVC